MPVIKQEEQKKTMRKFNLKENAARRIRDLEKAGAPCAEERQNPDQDAASAVVPAGGIHYAWRTDVGRVRKNNQDAIIIGNGLMGVADGMGGHNGGEIASGGLRDGLLRETEHRTADSRTLEEAVTRVNLELWQKQEYDASLTGMGTTLTVLWPGENEMILAQVGDSRAYLIRDGRMRKVTEDHSMVADMVRRGVLTEEQAACHPMRNYITRAVGTEDTIEVDLYREKRQKGDRWLICSDGLYGQMDRGTLEKLAAGENLEEAADALLQTALENGGKDNISLILIDDLIEPEQEKEPNGTTDPSETENKDGAESVPSQSEAAPEQHDASDVEGEAME